MTHSAHRQGTWLYRTFTLLCLLWLSQVFAVAQAAPTIVSPSKGSTLPAATLNQPYSVTFTATSGVVIAGWYECDVNDPSYTGLEKCLPTGLNIAESAGSTTTTLSGTPSVAGTYTFRISVADDNFDADVGSYTLVVGTSAAPSLTGISPNSGTTAGGTSVTLTGTNLTGATAVTIGGTAATSVTVVNATTITATTPVHASGMVDVRVTTPGGTATLTNAYTYVTPTPTLSNVSPSSGSTAGGTIVTLTGTNLTGATGVTLGGLSATGIVVVNATTITATTPAHAAGAVHVVVTTPGGTATLTNAYTYLTPAPTLSSVSPNSGSTAGGTSVTLTGTNFSGATGVTFGGLSATGIVVVNATTITATTPANAAGAVNVVVTTPGGTATLTNGYTYIDPSPPVVIAITPITLDPLTTGTAYSQALSASGGNGSYTWSTTGSLPPGITVSSAGLVSGTPTSSGTYNFTITATDSIGSSGSLAYNVTVTTPTLVISPSSLPNATASNAYSETLSSANGTAPYSYAVTAGSLPPGLVLAPGGVLSGTPSAVGTFNFTITSTDAHNATGSKAYSSTVDAATLAITPTTLGPLTTGTAYSQTLSATGGNGSYTWSTTGSLPPGITVSGAGMVSGTPTSGGTYNFTVTATDSIGSSGSLAYGVTVTTPTLVISPNTLPGGIQGNTYAAALSTTQGTAPYVYRITAGNLPAGLSLDPSTGEITGSLDSTGTGNFTVTTTDIYGATGSQTYSIAVAAPIVHSKTLPGGAGQVDIQMTSTTPGCTVDPSDLRISTTGIPAATPNVSFPLGVLFFSTSAGCSGAALQVRLVYPAGTLAGLQMKKYGPYGSGLAATGWFTPSTLVIAGDTVTYTVQDDGEGDNETSVPGVIRDPFGPLAVAAAAGTVAVPSLSQWAMLLMSGLLGLLGLRHVRQRQHP